MNECGICGKECAGLSELADHYASHAVRPVKENPLSYLLVLPDGVTEGRHEAAEAFADAYLELRCLHPDKRFDYFPFAYKIDHGIKESALTAILAVVR